MVVGLHRDRHVSAMEGKTRGQPTVGMYPVRDGSADLAPARRLPLARRRRAPAQSAGRPVARRHDENKSNGKDRAQSTDCFSVASCRGLAGLPLRQANLHHLNSQLVVEHAEVWTRHDAVQRIAGAPQARHSARR
jgi:hypothetical protein